MNNEEITSGNILIAKFMGHKIWMIKRYKGDIQPDRIEISTKDYESYLKKGFVYDSYARPFHSSWDYLMKVVDKINKGGLYDVIIYPSSCQIIAIGLGEITHVKSKNLKYELIDITYKAIIYFLKQIY